MRGEVALTLGRIGSNEGVPALVSVLRKDPASEVRRRCAIALAMFQDPSVVGDLEQALANEGDLQVRKAIEDALRGLP